MPEHRSSDPPLRCAELLAALSLVTDLGMGNPPETAMRGCLLATAVAGTLGLDRRDAADVYYTTLLRYVGCTGPAHEQALLSGGDDIRLRGSRARLDSSRRREAMKLVWSESPHLSRLTRAQRLANLVAHPRVEREIKTADCEVATSIARRIGLSDGVRHGLLEIFERWDGHGVPRGLRTEAIALAARFAQVATTWVLLAPVVGRDIAFHLVGERRGGQLDPTITQAFMHHAPKLLDELEGVDVWQAVLDAEPAPYQGAAERDIDNIAAAFGDVVDLKTPFTPGHAAGVADLAFAAARELRFSEQASADLRRAAHLHDLGRAGVPNGAWERDGHLTTTDWEQVRLHAYHTERILSRSAALAPLAAIAGMHHERQDGSGYHRQIQSTTIPLSARVLAAADVFQALTQERPHRPARSAESAAEVVTMECKAGRLDAAAVSAILTAAGQRRRVQRREWPCDLSDREVEVLRLLARGCSTRDIARQLVISPKTADHHVQHVYAKIGVSTRAAATLFALEHGLLMD